MFNLLFICCYGNCCINLFSLLLYFFWCILYVLSIAVSTFCLLLQSDVPPDVVFLYISCYVVVVLRSNYWCVIVLSWMHTLCPLIPTDWLNMYCTCNCMTGYIFLSIILLTIITFYALSQQNCHYYSHSIHCSSLPYSQSCS